MERTKETLEARVRETPLVDRLKECRQRIGKMCSEGRPPRMCIPVQHDDDDFFISTTLSDAQATVEALQAAANYYKQPSKNGGVYSVSGGHIGNLMDWCKDNLKHCKFSGPDEDNLDLDLVQTAQQIPQLKTELSQLQALVRALPNIEDEIMVSESFVLVEDLDMCSDMSDKREAEAYAALLRYRATLDATPTEEAT